MPSNPHNQGRGGGFGQQKEELQRVAFPDGTEVVVGTVAETVQENGVWRTREHTYSVGLHCGCTSSDAGEIHQCRTCPKLVCTQHAHACHKCARPICLDCSKIHHTDHGPLVLCKECNRSVAQKIMKMIIEFCKK